MNKNISSYIEELKVNNSVYEYHDEEFGNIRLMIIYKGEGLYFQINNEALICEISAHSAVLSKNSIKKWDNGRTINEAECEKIINIISKYYKLSYMDDLIIK